MPLLDSLLRLAVFLVGLWLVGWTIFSATRMVILPRSDNVPLVFFRSPQPQRSWITAAGTVMDTTALIASTVQTEGARTGWLAIRGGFIALRHIADFFDLAYLDDPQPNDPISITYTEFTELYDTLAAHGVHIHADREQCWRDYAGWRVNYDAMLLQLAQLTMASYAPWVSDRSSMPPQAPQNAVH